jgi:hypothetical protein
LQELDQPEAVPAGSGRVRGPSAGHARLGALHGREDWPGGGTPRRRRGCRVRRDQDDVPRCVSRGGARAIGAYSHRDVRRPARPRRGDGDRRSRRARPSTWTTSCCRRWTRRSAPTSSRSA